MKQLQHQLVRFFAFTILAMAVACCLAYLLLLSGGDHPYLIACVAAAIGAALAEPQRTVVCFSGDGSILMNIQEMVTAAEEGANVKVILMNNASLGLVYQQQTLFYGERIYASKFQSVPDFIKVAEGFGMRAVDLDKAEQPRVALAEALNAPGPCLIHASIDMNEKVFPMVPPGASNKEMIGG